jgi:hypothetical protein
MRSISQWIRNGATPFGPTARRILPLRFYFGTDQSQVQRYLAGGSLTAGRRADLQRDSQAAHAVLHPLYRVDGFRLLISSKATALLISCP